MNGKQLTLWDNIALENGYRSLSNLKFEEALGYFENALKSGTGDMESIRRMIEVCIFWKDRLSEYNKPDSGASGISGLLVTFAGYRFPFDTGELKRSLLIFITREIQKIPDPDEKDIEMLFELWLESGEYSQAEDLVIRYIENNPGKYGFYYLLAQAQWNQDNYIEAGNAYARVLLFSPDKYQEKRIESRSLRKLIRLFGPHHAAAFGWIRGILPLISQTGDIKPVDENHQRALSCYSLLREAHQAMLNNDMISCINYRKKLKSANVELYEEYFNLLKQRKLKI